MLPRPYSFLNHVRSSYLGLLGTSSQANSNYLSRPIWGYFVATLASNSIWHA